jgi:hypothetical protein
LVSFTGRELVAKRLPSGAETVEGLVGLTFKFFKADNRCDPTGDCANIQNNSSRCDVQQEKPSQISISGLSSGNSVRISVGVIEVG